jgi:hypothetical protein
MRAFFVFAAMLFFGTHCAFAETGLQSIEKLSIFRCESGKTCSLKCWGAGGDLTDSYKELLVYQFKDHPRRLWLILDNQRNYVAAVDQTCKFEGILSVGGVADTTLSPSAAPPQVSIVPPTKLK